jgi:hypothetical protein
MSEKFSGLEPDDAAATDAGLAERLIRDEFSEAAPAHHTWFHREAKAEATGAGESLGEEAAGSGVASGDEALVDRGLVPVAHETAEVPVVASDSPWTDETIVVSAAAIHEAFVEPTRPPRPPRSRSHRAGMLAGLAVVGALLALLVVLAPGGSKPRLPAQSVHDVSPVAASGPKTDAATTPSTSAPTTTSSAPAASTTSTPSQRQGETITTFITYSLVPGTPAVAPTTAPAATTPTAPADTTTTTAPPPPTTTPTTAPKHCLLGILC